MALDPQAQAVRAALAGMPPLDFAQLTVPAYRAMLAAGGGFAPGDSVAAEEDLTIPTANGPIAARLYRPALESADEGGNSNTLLPLTVFFHAVASFPAGWIPTQTFAVASRSARERSCYRSITGLRPKHAFRPPRSTRATPCAGRRPIHVICACGPARLP